MVGMGEISALAASLKAAGDLAKAMVGLRDAQVFQAKAIELQGTILSAQGDAMTAFAAHSDLIEQVRALKEELAALEDWDAQKQRYELKEHGGNRVKAYALKDGVEPPEPPHSACPDCYQQRQISIVQEVRKAPGMSVALECHKCGWEGYVDGFWRPEYGGKKGRR